MKRLLVLVVLVCVVWFAVQAWKGRGAMAAERQDYTEQWEKDFPKGTSLRLDFTEVDVHVEGTEASSMSASFSGWRVEGASGYLPSIELVQNGSEIVLKETRQTWSLWDLAFWARPRLVGTLTVKVPKQALAELKVDTVSGKGSIAGLTAEKAKLESVSGSLELAQIEVTGTLTVEAVSGGLSVSHVTAGNCTLENTSGKIETEALHAGGKVKVEKVSGRLSMKDTQAETLSIEATSSGVEMNRVRAGTLDVRTVSGKIEGAEISTGDLRAQTTSGAVLAELREAANVKVGTVSGRVEVGMPSGSQFTYAISTVSGGVDVGFVYQGDNRKGQVGDGRNVVKIETVSGRVSLQPTGQE